MVKLECSVVTLFSQIDESLEKEWDDLAARTNAGIYMTFRWIRVWWDFYGDSHKLRLFFFRRDGILSAVFPIYIQRIRLGITSTYIAHLLGSDVPPRVFDPPVDTPQADEISSLLIQRLIVDEGCDLVSLGPVSEQWANRIEVRKFAESHLAKIAGLEIKSTHAHTLYQLPNSFDEYFSTLSHKERRSRRQKMNIFTKDFSPQTEVLTEPFGIDNEIELCMEMHNSQWVKERMLGTFGGWPKAESFNKKVAHELATVGRAWLMKTTIDKKAVSYQYAFVLGDNCFWIAMARIGGEKWERYSLGAINSLFFLRHCIEKGVKRIESGLGSFSYKTKLGGIEASTVILRYASMKFSGRVKYSLFRFISGFIDIFYNKIYYNRIQPRLPARLRRPNWMGWIRLRY